jgi:EpsI family protein
MKTMTKSMFVSIVLGFFMVLSGIVAKVMTPAEVSPALHARINLEMLIPKEFEGWKLDSYNASGIVNPEVKGALGNIYNQTLSRTYINNAGDRIMLSIAYGGEQKTDMHAHRPEICYAAGGFDISDKTKTFFDTTLGRIPVMHLVATQGTRIEPITYWIRVGDALTRGWLEQKLTAIGYGLTGKVPDGLLVRVSSISNDEQNSYRVQREFLSAMLKAVRSEDRFWLVGRLNS